jgi:hypothetical protein
VYLSTAREIAELYDRLSMTLPDTSTVARQQIVSRNRNLAARLGYATPLAWDDIDLDEAPQAEPAVGRRLDVDEVLVERVLGGDWPLARKANHAERRAVVLAWASRGGSTFELGRRTGWKPERYARVSEVIAS